MTLPAKVGGTVTLAVHELRINIITLIGNTCDDANDPNGCIFTLNLLVEDASIDEINAAVVDIQVDSGSDASEATATAASATITASVLVLVQSIEWTHISEC